MAYSLSFIFFTGLIIASVFAMRANPKWQAKLMLIPSIISFFCYIIMAVLLADFAWENMNIIEITGAINLICITLYIIGLLFYCLKTYSATKSNEQLDFLNFQLKDQLEIRLSNQAEKSSPPEISQV